MLFLVYSDGFIHTHIYTFKAEMISQGARPVKVFRAVSEQFDDLG